MKRKGQHAADRGIIADGWETYYSTGQVPGGYPVSSSVENFLLQHGIGEGPILEIACGAGRTYSHLMDLLFPTAEVRPFYIGLDSSISALKRAILRQGFTVVLGDMLRLPFPQESFAFVYSRNAFSGYSRDSILSAGLEIERVLMKGGLLVVEDRGPLDRTDASGTTSPPAPCEVSAILRTLLRPLSAFRTISLSESLGKRDTASGSFTLHTTSAILTKC